MDILERFHDREMIVVLTWDAEPKDLDSRMTYQDGETNYHIFFDHKVDEDTGTNLDIDKMTGFGPEVVTVLELGTGTYRYSVYDYTHGGSMTSNGIATSRAHIAVYIGGQLKKSYDVPQGMGCLWTLFEYNGSTGEFKDINTMSGGMCSSDVK